MRCFSAARSLKRAFTHIVDNAVKYGGCCEVELRCGPAEASVLIRDHGLAIPPEAAEHVLVPLFRPERSRKRRPGASGLA